MVKHANGEVTATQEVKLLLNTATTANALIMMGCPNMLSLGNRCAEEGFVFVWNSGRRPVLTFPGGQEFDWDIENYIPVFHTPWRHRHHQTILLRAGQTSRIYLRAQFVCEQKRRTRRIGESQHVNNGSLDYELGATPAKLGEHVTADHDVLGSFQESSRRGDIVALIVHGHATKRTGCHPNPSNSAHYIMMGIMHFVGTDDKLGHLCTDGSWKLSLPARKLLCRLGGFWGGTRSLVLQSGLPHPCWAAVANSCCTLRNPVHKVEGDKTPHFLRHGSKFVGQ